MLPVPNPEIRLGEILAALTYALDLAEGQAAGHALRACLIGMTLAEKLGLGDVQRVLQQLLREGVSIRDLGAILESIGDRAATTRDTAALVEAAALLHDIGKAPGGGHATEMARRVDHAVRGGEWLREHGFRTNPYAERFESIEEVAAACRDWERRRAELDYEIDGIVIKLDSLPQQRELAALHGRPRWARAFKWAPMTAQTKLLKIHVRVGRTGALNPWAWLEPVEVGGVTVSRATLHNEEDINRKEIRAGDDVIVQRAGDVIPQIVGPAGPHRPGTKRFRMPAHCPLCGTEVVKPERIAYSHGGGRKGGPGIRFASTWTFEALPDDRTRVTIRQLFASTADRERVVREFNAVEGGMQTLARLAEYLPEMAGSGAAVAPGPAFLFTREFDAPRDLVFKAWTERERLQEWWGPQGFGIRVAKLDLRPGGVFHYGMQTPDGREVWGRFAYREIAAPERLGVGRSGAPAPPGG